VGWFARFDSAGTAIHERGWAAVPYKQDVSFFNTVIQASDGGTVLFGSAQVYDSTSGGYSQDAWIVKLDSNGCDIDTCPHIVSSASLHEPLSNGEYIRCVPNPATDNFTILYSGLTEGEKYLELYSIDGRKIYQIFITELNGQVIVSTQNLPQGLYTCVLKLNGKTLSTSKVVIIK
jgi:hypothetical protein